jgi:hypothetical protein
MYIRIDTIDRSIDRKKLLIQSLYIIVRIFSIRLLRTWKVGGCSTYIILYTDDLMMMILHSELLETVMHDYYGLGKFGGCSTYIILYTDDLMMMILHSELLETVMLFFAIRQHQNVFHT